MTAGEKRSRWYESAILDEHGRPALVVDAIGDEGLHLLYSDGFQFAIDWAGTEVWAEWGPADSLEEASSYLLGPVMGFVLRLRGQVLLHASAISTPAGAMALVGEPRAGKSTTAAGLAVQGYPVLSDDIVPLGRSGSEIVALPGYPRIRLRPEAVEACGAVGARIRARLPDDWGYRRVHVNVTEDGMSFESKARPLRAIYVMGARHEGTDAVIAPLDGQEALMALVTHSFASGILDAAMRRHDLDELAQLARSVPVRRVAPSRDLARLPALCDALLRDLSMLTGTEARLPALSDT